MIQKVLFTFFFIGFYLGAFAQIHGVVLDDHNHELLGASVVLQPLGYATTTTIEGAFSFTGLDNGRYSLITSYIGYLKDTTEVEWQGEVVHVKIKLVPFSEALETVVILDEHAKQEMTLNVEHVTDEFLQKNLEGSFSKSIEKLPGISSINVGVGIAKPVIRGLSANRIIINQQGVKQESQQWGSDHGLEIDQFDVERVEIIKGPGSLQYGSDGMGGVINIMPAKIVPKNSFAGSVMGIYKSNNLHVGSSAKLGVNVNNWFVSARYSYQDFADYKVPADVFTYNGFDLPIVNNRLKNTAGNEENINVTAGVNKEWGITRFTFSHYGLEAGLFSGAVGVPRSYALTDDGNIRDIDIPKQEVDHCKMIWNQTFYLGDHHLVFDVGLQRNIRREFSEPEFHSIPLSQLEDPNDKLAIELILETFSIASHYEYHQESGWKHIIGSSVQWQQNERAGFEYLLPNFKTFRGGLYGISEKELSSKWLVNGGVRLDVGTNNTEYFKQYIWDSNETTIDSLESIATDDIFYNWSASIGSNYSFGEGRYVLKLNLGKSFRVPYPAETVSNGIHHGTFRHEVGTPDLKTEQGYQFDVGVSWDFDKFHGSFATYFNYFDQYIYLGPTFPARFSQLPEAGQIFQYRQDDAIYTGFELQWEYELRPKVHLNQAIDYIQSFNPVTTLALPFTPQPSVRTELIFSPFNYKRFQHSYIELGHEYHLGATGPWRVDRSEQETPAYQLWNVGMGTDISIANQELKLKFQVQNLFNTPYLAHLSRYRIINVPEQGRNLVLSVFIPFNGAL